MVISTDFCKPYFSGVLIHTPDASQQSIEELRQSIVELIQPIGDGGAPQRQVSDIDNPAGVHEDMQWAAIPYIERRRPPWYQGEDLTDVHNHLIVVCGIGTVLSIAFTENGMRNQIVRRIRDAPEAPLDQLTIFSGSEIKQTLVATGVRTLWLTGTHRQSAVKADNKTLSGIELESAIDPLGDQTYFYSSIRTTLPGTGLGKRGNAAVVGTSPVHGRYWVGPSDEWNDFLSRNYVLLQHVTQALNMAQGAPILPMLAQPGSNLNEVSEPYGLSLVVPENQFPDALLGGAREWLQQFADTAAFEIHPEQGSANFEADIVWAGETLGRIAYRFEESSSGSVLLRTQIQTWEYNGDGWEEILDICQDHSLLTVYFDTGHTYSREDLYRVSFRDPIFAGWKWAPMHGYDVKKEKPAHNGSKAFASDLIGADGENSLFSLVVNHWPNLADRGQPTGWLVCDDGSMESADFIHIDPNPNNRRVALIHVKGSDEDSPNRNISVSDYEVVVGQAVKNLRHLDRSNLFDKLSGNTDHRLVDAVWHNGQRQENREEVLEVIEGLGSNYQVEVYVLQPRIRESVWIDVRDQITQGWPENDVIRRLKQLDTLLQGASADCHGLGARFFAIGEAG